jgi:hypothetical protein
MSEKGMLLSLHYPLSWSNGFYNGRAQEVLLLHIVGDHGREMSTRKEGEKVKHEQKSKTAFFGHILKKIPHI